MLRSLARTFVRYSTRAAAALLGVACGAEGPAPASVALGRSEQGFVNGADDRLEYFELDEPAQRAAIEQSGVALMSASAATAITDGRSDLIPSWGAVNALCDDQPFAEQPSAAFCSGVLLDWNLVLTSGHCIDTLPLERLRVAFGFYYGAEDELAMQGDDSYAVARVVVSRRDPAVEGDLGERLDYAWLELAEPARAPHRPAPVYATGRGVSEGDTVISIGAGGGVPLKWDAGGHVRDSRSDFDDYFIADTDTSQGSSGGGVFDQGLAVVGSLARGAADFSLTSAGCFATNVESDPSQALEQFTYVHRAVDGLCATGFDSVLCDAECGEPCDAGSFEPSASSRRDRDDGGCALEPGAVRSRTPGDAAPLGLGLALAAMLARRRARSHQWNMVPSPRRAIGKLAGT